MKNQGPIQRHQTLVPFSKDHHFGLLLVWKIRQGLSKAVAPLRISNYVLYFFKEDLQKHFSEEEQHLFPKLPPEDPLRKQAEAEHEKIRAVISAIEMDKNDIALLSQFADMLQDHIRFEERVLFNHIQGLIPDDQSQTGSNKGNTPRKDIDIEWKDIFWNTDHCSL